MKKFLGYLSISALLIFGSFSYVQASNFVDSNMIAMKCGEGKCGKGKCGSSNEACDMKHGKKCQECDCKNCNCNAKESCSHSKDGKCSCDEKKACDMKNMKCGKGKCGRG